MKDPFLDYLDQPDRRRYTRFVSAYLDPLSRLARRIVGCPDVADDVVQESFLRLAEVKLDPAKLANPRAYVLRTTYRLAFELFKLAPSRTEALPLQLHSEWSAGLVMLWQTVVVCLVAGYVFSYYFSASMVIYMLMRRVCDGQELEEIWQPGEALPAVELDDDEEADDGEDEDEDDEEEGLDDDTEEPR